MKKGTLYLVPCPIGENQPLNVLPQHTLEKIRTLTHFAAENLKTARHFIKACDHPTAIQEIDIMLLDKKTKYNEVSTIAEPLLKGHDMGVVSESGCPGVADPGSILVQYAHSKDIQVVPLIGPSSILLAMMSSGFNGQSFAFHGYLPKNSDELKQKIKDIEKASAQFKQTQIFIETPYRTDNLTKSLIQYSNPNSFLCIASSLNCPDERIISKPIHWWKKQTISFGKAPCVFLLFSK